MFLNCALAFHLTEFLYVDDGDFYGSNEDLNIHVHKEGGTGGNVCSKIVFFFLFSALIVLVGLIIKENQGLNERKPKNTSHPNLISTLSTFTVENIESESRFSQIFEGWVDDKSADDHDDHSPEVSNEHDDEDHDASEEDEPEEDQSQEQDEDEELEDAVSRSQEVDETEEEAQSEQVSEEQNEDSEGNEESEEAEDSAEPTETVDSAEPTEKEDSVESTEEKRQSDEQNVDSKESQEAALEEVEGTEDDDVEEEPKVC